MSICMGCMEEKGSSAICPKCGWQEGTAADSPVGLQPRTLLNSRYLLGRVLGQGGYGITYLAWDVTLEGKRAIKEYFPQSICIRGRDERTVRLSNQRGKDVFDSCLKKFVEEGKALERFRDHHGIVKCFDFFYAHETAYIVMEFMDGLTFSEYLRQHGGKVPFETAVRVLIPVMDALREVHGAGMLHRDVAPDNIHINKNRQVKLLDFGSTRFALREQTQNLGDVKPGYTPMEVYSSTAGQGPWTDVYSLGATLYRAVTGKSPPSALDRLGKDELVPPSRLGVEMNPVYEAALLKALAVRPAARFQTVAEFESIVAPSVVRPPGPPIGLSLRPLFVVAGVFLLVVAFAFSFYRNAPAGNVPVPGKDSNSPGLIAPTDKLADVVQAPKGAEVTTPPSPPPQRGSTGRPLNTRGEVTTPPSPPPQRVRIGGNEIATYLVFEVKPTYPTLAKQARIQGIVVLEAEISKEGTIYELKVITGHPLLVQLAIEAVKQWRYKPVLLNGEPVPVVTTITVRFPEDTAVSAQQFEIQDRLLKAEAALASFNYSQAVADYKRVLEIQPNNGRAQAGLKRANDAWNAEQEVFGRR